MVRGDVEYLRRRRARIAIEADPVLRERWDAAIAELKELTGTDDEVPEFILAEGIQLAGELDPRPPVLRDRDPGARLDDPSHQLVTRWFTHSFPLMPDDEGMRSDDIVLKYGFLHVLAYLNGGIRLDELQRLGGLDQAWDVLSRWVDDTRAGR